MAVSAASKVILKRPFEVVWSSTIMVGGESSVDLERTRVEGWPDLHVEKTNDASVRLMTTPVASVTGPKVIVGVSPANTSILLVAAMFYSFAEMEAGKFRAACMEAETNAGATEAGS